MTSTGHTPAVTPPPGPRRHSRSRPSDPDTPPLTVGVEEEFLLVDPASRELRADAEKVVAEAAGELGDRVGPELTRYQVETRTDPHTGLADLADQVRSTRQSLARAAARRGLGVIATGTPVFAPPGPPPLTEGPRYSRSAETFRALDDEQIACACHVHVGVPDLATALSVSNHLRPWIPLLIVLSANSPYWGGRDTGYASWRTTTWGRWPVAGPPPYFASAPHFEELVGGLLANGTLLDRGGLYWDIRPSHHLPTLEFRAADATATADDTVLLAGIVRAMVATALTAVDAGEPPLRPSDALLRAACWRAARDGVTGKGIDPATGRLTPAVAQVEDLLSRLRPALDRHGDTDLVHDLWTRLRTQGGRAEGQRAARRRGAALTDVVDHLVTLTTPPD
ncbi:carboxylate-amine ligase [Streptomyces roseicoloratus]|uniref:carboxylate-amine ligase n=1 Tax=Streptomyces roseicoloratus TaxID=2508722 RepID=UPI0010098CEE|nr:glutamate--cysteine ligase [Streptomyces roseicoloratus]